MKKSLRIRFAITVIAASIASSVPAAAQQSAAPNTARPVGTVKAIAANNVTLTTDEKTDVTIQVQDTTRFLRLAPDQKDIRQATPVSFQELQVGDRMLATGTPAADGKTLAARTVVIMKKSDVAQKQEKDLEQWNHGVGGVVKAVDGASGAIQLSTGAPGAHPVTLHVGPKTIVRRYAPDSVKFDDAKVAKLDDIHPGDQLRARGTRTSDGTEMTADEIVAGTFRNLSGTIESIDAANQTLTIKDLATRKSVAVKFTPDSTLHQLPPQMAQMMAMRLRAPQGGQNGAAGPGGQQQFQRPQGEGRPADGAQRGGEGGARAGGFGGGRARSGDISQMLSMLPHVTLADLQKGEAVMVVTTQGTPTSTTAITLLSGVEPLLTASPNGGMVMTPWNLGGGGEGGAEQ